jgi:subtilase family serine protease
MLRTWFPQRWKQLVGGTSRSRVARRKPPSARLSVEHLEDRMLMSHSSLLLPGYKVCHPAGNTAPLASSGPVGFTPAQIRHAYGFDQFQFAEGVLGDGSGQTIAIVDAFDDANIATDLATFDKQFNLPAPPSFSKIAQDGSINLPIPAPKNSWGLETALDVEWAHAMAPGAKLLLVEANSADISNLMMAVGTAAGRSGVSVVSMSFGGHVDSDGNFVAGEQASDVNFDSGFVTPSGHGGVTFIAASGDNGVAEYPATSPNVLAVGGTRLTLGAGNSYGSETAWSGSGGGKSTIEARPSYQAGVLPQSHDARQSGCGLQCRPEQRLCRV